jgi:hypothetical protein
MDPISIATGALGIAGTIGKLSITISTFVRQVRDARGDMDAVLRELVSLKTILEMLADDAVENQSNNIPTTLTEQISGILNGCDGVVVQITETISRYNGNGIFAKGQWAISGRSDMDKLRSNLEAHKSALNMALELVPCMWIASSSGQCTNWLVLSPAKSKRIPRSCWTDMQISKTVSTKSWRY